MPDRAEPVVSSSEEDNYSYPEEISWDIVPRTYQRENVTSGQGYYSVINRARPYNYQLADSSARRPTARERIQERVRLMTRADRAKLTDFQAVILCGPGHQLHSFVDNELLPKAMLPVANRPMIFYPLTWLAQSGFQGTNICPQARSPRYHCG